MPNRNAESLDAAHGDSETAAKPSEARGMKPVGGDSVKKPKRNRSLDFLRGVAILMVLAWHAPISRPSKFDGPHMPVPFGWAGVDLFFVLSGFLVGGLLIGEYQRNQAIDSKRFIIRRAFKIWPSYFIYIVVAAGSRVFSHRMDEAKGVWTNLVHLQNYLGTPLPHTWSLSVEEHFYLALAFLFFPLVLRKGVLTQKRLSQSLGAAIAVIIVIRTINVFAAPPAHGVYFYTHTRIDGLCMGVLLAGLFHLEKERYKQLASKRGLLAIVALVGLAMLMVAPKYSPLMLSIGFTVNYLAASALLLLAFDHSDTGWWKRFGKVAPIAAVAWIGELSYSIYLWEFTIGKPVAQLFVRHFGTSQLSLAAGWVIWYCGAIFSGWAAYQIIEKTFLKIRDRQFAAKSVALT